MHKFRSSQLGSGIAEFGIPARRGLFCVVAVQEAVNRPALLIGDDRVQVDVFHAAENPGGNLGVFFRQGADKLLDFRPLGALLRAAAGGAAFRQAAGALDVD